MLEKNRVLATRVCFGILAFIVIELLLINMVDKPIAYITKELDLTFPQVIDFFRILTKLGLSKWYQWPTGVGAILLFTAYYLFKFRDNTRQKLHHLAQTLLFFFTSITVAGILANVFKVILGRARPKLLFINGTFGFDPLVINPDWDGMPSGHTTTVFALAASMYMLFPRSRPYAVAFALMLGLSRVMVNAHFMSDVLFGLVIGVGVTKIVGGWFREKGIIFGATQKG